MPVKTDDPVLSALVADFTSRKDRAGSIIADPKASPEQMAEATRLAEGLPGLHTRIETHRAVKGQLDEANEWAGTPNRTLPFAGDRRPDVQGTTPGGKTFRIDTGDSQIDRMLPTGGFKSLGHFAWAQARRGRHGDGDPAAVRELKSWDELLRKGRAWEVEQKTPTGLFEESDPDGGDLIPPQFSNSIYERMVAKNQILSYLSPITLTGNTVTIPKLKENSRVDGSRGGGVVGYWQGEADKYTNSKPQFSNVNLKLHKLTVLVYTTEELLQDSPTAIDSFVGKKASDEINFKINDAVINGKGNGQPIGITQSNSVITAPAASGQGSTSFTYNNVVTMFARVVAGQRSSLVWLYNQDVEPQLFLMYQSTGTTGVPIFMPNLDGTFRLLGRPTLVMEQCQTLGTAGDVIAFATDGYVCAQKGGIYSSMNMWLRWDYDEFAYKFRFRFDGQPYDDVALTPYKGSNTVSSIVMLSSSRT